MDEGFSITFLKNGEAEIGWSLSQQKIELISLYFDKPPYNLRKALRIYHVVNHDFIRSDASFYEKELLSEDTSYQYNEFIMGQSYFFEVGIKLDDKKFLTLIRSSLYSISSNSEQFSVQEKRENLKGNFSSPAWSESVSTYTLYENQENGWKQ